MGRELRQNTARSAKHHAVVQRHMPGGWCVCVQVALPAGLPPGLQGRMRRPGRHPGCFPSLNGSFSPGREVGRLVSLVSLAARTGCVGSNPQDQQHNVSNVSFSIAVAPCTCALGRAHASSIMQPKACASIMQHAAQCM